MKISFSKSNFKVIKLEIASTLYIHKLAFIIPDYCDLLMSKFRKEENVVDNYPYFPIRIFIELYKLFPSGPQINIFQLFITKLLKLIWKNNNLTSNFVY